MARVQMDLSDQSMERLKRLKDNIDASSYAEVMREALKLYEFMIDEETEGTEFFLKKRGKEMTTLKLFIG